MGTSDGGTLGGTNADGVPTGFTLGGATGGTTGSTPELRDVTTFDVQPVRVIEIDATERP